MSTGPRVLEDLTPHPETLNIKYSKLNIWSTQQPVLPIDIRSIKRQ